MRIRLCVHVPETPNWLITLALSCVPGVYIVLILSAVLVIGIGGGLIWLLIDSMSENHGINRFTIMLLVGLGCGTIIGTYAVIKAVVNTIWRKPEFEPALIINPTKEPDLMMFLTRLCSKLETSMPDYILLHAEPTFYVTQSKIITFDGNANGRILAIGLPLLGGLTVNELRSVLSHEFAHFTGEVTKYSSTVLPVYTGTSTAWISMEEGVASQSRMHDSVLIHYATIIPMMLPKYMLIAYLYLFHLLNMRISRTRECRADAIAVNTCGSQCFEKALLKVYAICGLYADDNSDDIIRQTANEQRIENHFRAFRLALPQLSARASDLAKQAYAQIQGKHDSHPSLKNRVQAMGKVPDQFSDKDQCTTLFTNLESYENTLYEQMTALMAMMNRE